MIALPTGVLLSRPRLRWFDRVRKYQVLIDDAQVGLLPNGGELFFPLAPGPHRLQVLIDWTGSPALKFDLAEGQLARYRVERTGDYVSRERYLKLEAV